MRPLYEMPRWLGRLHDRRIQRWRRKNKVNWYTTRVMRAWWLFGIRRRFYIPCELGPKVRTRLLERLM